MVVPIWPTVGVKGLTDAARSGDAQTKTIPNRSQVYSIISSSNQTKVDKKANPHEN